MNAWAYLAVSSDAQAETLSEQRAWADEAAALNGWRIDRYFQSVGTGKHGVRKLMQRLLEELQNTPKNTRPKRVLMSRLDRTGRGNTLDLIAAVAELKNLGITIHTRLDGDLSLRSVKDTIKPIFDLIQAGIENETRADRSRQGHAKRRREGKHAGHAPYGIRTVDGIPIPDENAFVVKEMFRLRLEGWGTHRITRHISAIAPPKRRIDGTVRSMKWGENTVGRMLACQTYRGLIVSEDVWDAVQAMRAPMIGRQPKYEWPLRGAVRCTCGHMLSTSYSGPKRKRFRYYTCRNVAVHSERYPLHRADHLEQQFVDLLRRIAEDPEILNGEVVGVDIDAIKHSRETVTAKIADIDTRRRRAWEIAEAGGIGPNDLRERIAELMEQRKAFEVELRQIEHDFARAMSLSEAVFSTAEAVKHMAEAWPVADIEDRREMAKAVAAYVGGLYVAPGERRMASHTMLQYGLDEGQKTI